MLLLMEKILSEPLILLILLINYDLYFIRHPELVSGSPGFFVEMLKQVQQDGHSKNNQRKSLKSAVQTKQ